MLASKKHVSLRLGISALALASCILCSGCGSNDSEPTADPATETATTNDQQAQSAIDPVDPSAESDAASRQNGESVKVAKTYEAGSSGVTKASSPTEVCDAFVRSLHERNTLAAERLLTLTSRITMHDHELELQPIAGENAQYVIGDAKYATQLKQLAYVDCHVSDRSEAGEETFVVRWMLKPEAGYGWRVFGMVMNEAGGNQMINFENSDHAQVVSDIYLAEENQMEPGIDQPISRQANNSETVNH